MKAIVTGGAGFIGSHMVDLLLDRGFRVQVIDDFSAGRERNVDPRAAIWREDIRNLSGDAFAGAKYVFHFAGIGDIVPSIERPLDYMSVNVQGTVNVLECARKAGAKVIYAASSSCYGLAPTPTTESIALNPKYPYALSKMLGEQALLHWHDVYGLPVNSIRIFNAYGPRSRTSGAYGAVFGVFLKQKLAGFPFTVVGDGTQSRDFVYVSDVARAFLAAAESPYQRRIYNVGGGSPQSINRLVQLLGGPVVYVPERPGEPDCTWADISMAREGLQWTPKVKFEDGVSQLLDQIEYWRDAPLWDSESIAKATQRWFEVMA